MSWHLLVAPWSEYYIGFFLSKAGAHIRLPHLIIMSLHVGVVC